MNKKAKLLCLSGGLAALLYFFQEFIFEDANKTKESKAYMYSFQLNFWENALEQKFDSIRISGAASRLIIGKDIVNVDRQFFIDLYTYQEEMKSVLRILRRQYQIPLLIIDDISEMEPYGLKTKEEKDRFISEWKKFEVFLGEHKAREARLESYFSELMAAFSKNLGKMEPDEKVSLTIKQIELLRELYSTDLLFLKHNGDSLKFVSDLANQSNHYLKIYEDALDRYNKSVSIIQTEKQIIISILTLLSIVLAFHIEMGPQEKRKKSDGRVHRKTM